MEARIVSGGFVGISELRPGEFFRFTSNGTEYQLVGSVAPNDAVSRTLFVCRRIELDGRTGNFFVIEDDRPVIATRVAPGR